MITIRSVTLGLLGVVFIAALTPYNNLIVKNTFLIGGTLPVVVVLLILLLTLLGGVLRMRLSGAERATILAMLLAGCAAPAIGFVQYVAGVLPGISQAGEASPTNAKLLESIGLPAWAFPATLSPDANDAGQASVRALIDRVAEGDSISFAPWLTPMLAWGVLGVLLFAAVMMLSVLVRKQWMENERLPFPVANILVSLIAEDRHAPGRLPPMLRSGLFWGAVSAVVVVRSLSELNRYWPAVPAVPLSFDLASLFVNPPLSFASDLLYRSGIYFVVIGVTFFLQTRIAFSIWFLFVASQVVRMGIGATGGEITESMRQDQTLGALVSFVALLLWVGRSHCGMIVRHMVGRQRVGEEAGEYVTYRTAGWLLLACAGGVVVWLTYAGVGVGSAIYIVLFLGIISLTVARVAAETGLSYIQIPYPITRPPLLALSEEGWAPSSTRSFFWMSTVGALFAHDTREPASTYFTHGLKTADVAGTAAGRRKAGLVIAMLAAVAVSLPVAMASHLYFDFRNASTLADPPETPVNSYAVNYMPTSLILAPTAAYDSGKPVPAVHSVATHVGIGMGLSTLFGVCRLRFEWFPLHPLGVLLVYSFPVARMWFSIFLGWLAKVIVVRLGGGGLMTRVSPLFIGLAVGECVAAGLWLGVNCVAASAGARYFPVYFTP